jgi:hypothetical protein
VNVCVQGCKCKVRVIGEFKSFECKNGKSSMKCVMLYFLLREKRISCLVVFEVMKLVEDELLVCVLGLWIWNILLGKKG